MVRERRGLRGTDGFNVMTLHAFVICWPATEENSAKIAADLVASGYRTTVLYNTHDGSTRDGPGEWHQVDDDWHFGRKIGVALSKNEGQVLLLIVADAHSDDWPGLVGRCLMRFQQNSSLGLWCPFIDHSPWHDVNTEICSTPGGEMLFVAQTDGIVLALNSPVSERLSSLSFADNNLGWGIDWAAIAFCYSHGLLVIRDNSVRVTHPQSRSYSFDGAMAQMDRFLVQLTDQETIAYVLLRRFVDQNRYLNELDG